MRVLILSPTIFPSITGNAITVERWRRALEDRGLTVQTLATRDQKISLSQEAIDRFRPDLIHAHHAFHSGVRLLDISTRGRKGDFPYVVSPGGTDLNLDLEITEKKEAISRVFQWAGAIIVQGPGVLERLKEIPSIPGGRVFPVPKSVLWFGNDPFPLRHLAGCFPGDVLFFLPAGVRPVKGNLECLSALERVHEARSRARLVFAGPGVEPTYSARFAVEVRRCAKFAAWIPPIRPAAMRSAYEQADVVINASLSEGLSNSLLEGMAAGKPLLASDIAGNRGPIQGKNGEEPAGLLFNPRDPQDFFSQALRLIDDPALRNSLGQAGRRRADTWTTLEKEAEGLLRAYEFALKSPGP